MSRRLLVLASLVGATLLGVVLVLVRNLFTGNPDFRYLIWNLFLAWIPFALALAAYAFARRGRLVVALSVAWLLFFPNAPYIVTDFVHLEHDPLSPYWYDALTIGVFAATGLALGFASLALQQSVTRRFLGARASWIVVLAASALGSLGIYLGRFVRTNTWDVLTNPHLFAHLARVRLADPLGNPRLLVVIAAFTLLLGAGYALVYAVAASRLELDRH